MRTLEYEGLLLEINHKRTRGKDYITINARKEGKAKNPIKRQAGNAAKRAMPNFIPLEESDGLLNYNYTSLVPLAEKILVRHLRRDALAGIVCGAADALDGLRPYDMPYKGALFDAGYICVDEDFRPKFIYLPFFDEAPDSGIGNFEKFVIGLAECSEVKRDGYIDGVKRLFNHAEFSFAEFKKGFRELVSPGTDTDVRAGAGIRMKRAKTGFSTGKRAWITFSFISAALISAALLMITRILSRGGEEQTALGIFIVLVSLTAFIALSYMEIFIHRPKRIKNKPETGPSYAWLVFERDGKGEKAAVSSDRFVIGRDSGKCRLVVKEDMTVGRVHAEVIRKKGMFFIRQIGEQTNGTFVTSAGKGRRALEPDKEFRLTDGDIIILGRTEITFRSPENA
jgi:hypothetical protein